MLLNVWYFSVFQTGFLCKPENLLCNQAGLGLTGTCLPSAGTNGVKGITTTVQPSRVYSDSMMVAKAFKPRIWEAEAADL